MKVAVLLERTHAVIARPTLEEVAEGECREGGVTAGAATADDDPPQVHQSLLRQEFGADHAIVHIDDAPIEFEPLPIFTAEPRAATVVDVEHCNAAAGPELRPEVERTRRRRGGATV